jgi:hypothetical protein
MYKCTFLPFPHISNSASPLSSSSSEMPQVMQIITELTSPLVPCLVSKERVTYPISYSENILPCLYRQVNGPAS